MGVSTREHRAREYGSYDAAKVRDNGNKGKQTQVWTRYADMQIHRYAQGILRAHKFLLKNIAIILNTMIINRHLVFVKILS